MKSNYYEILNIPTTADTKTIKKAFYALALQFHPDRVSEKDRKNAENKFKEISLAYAVLLDSKKRTIYKSLGHSGLDKQFTPRDIIAEARNSGLFDLQEISDLETLLFEVAIRMSLGHHRKEFAKGQDIEIEVNFDFNDVYNGCKKEISYPRNEYCKDCSGTGAQQGRAYMDCPDCLGLGMARNSGITTTCSSCAGRGHLIKESCSSCAGQGFLKKQRSLLLPLQSGGANTIKIRCIAEGDIGHEGAGDLYIYPKISPHSLFQIKNDDIYISVKVDFVKASLGALISVPTPKGAVNLKLPRYTPSGTVFRIKNHGIPYGTSRPTSKKAGDLLVTILHDIPKRSFFSKKGRLLNEYLHSLGTTNTTAIKKLSSFQSFIWRIKNYLSAVHRIKKDPANQKKPQNLPSK